MGGAFSDCANLTSVTIPSSVTKIGELAFYGCKKLATVIIPNSETSIEADAFGNCPNLVIRTPAGSKAVQYAKQCNIRTLPNSAEVDEIMQMAGDVILVRGGRFLDSHGPSTVDSFFIGRTEVTQKFYSKIMGKNPSYYAGENHPVENVTWYDAVNFCNRLSELLGFEKVYTIDGTNVTWNRKANGFRLPDTSEFAYAYYGGQQDKYRYPGSNNVNEVSWNEDNAGDHHEVATKKPNGYGLYDMHGNVAEWCWDTKGDHGHAILGHSTVLYVHYREYDSTYYKDYDLGFRIVRNAQEEK